MATADEKARGTTPIILTDPNPEAEDGLAGRELGNTRKRRRILEPPVYDNFYSPENRVFYCQSPYKALDPTKRQIRLLRVLPSDEDKILSFTLLDKCNLDPIRSRYTALSYCAGDPRKTEVIRINGLEFNAFANLGYALNEVLTYWRMNGMNEDEELLWADQICINQSDPDERSHQVGQMREIYANAEIVLISLATKDTSSRSASAVDWTLNLWQKLQHIGCTGMTETADSLCNIGFYNYVVKHLADSKFQEGAIAFSELIGSPWLRRAWIWQEFMVAPDAAFLYGGASIHWKAFAIVMKHLANRDLGFMRALSFAFSAETRISIRLHDALEGGLRLNFAFVLVQRKQDWKGPGDLRNWLECSRMCFTSDPRDRVYAFLGLAHPHYNIVPDYSPSNTMKHLALEVASKILVAENTLDLLAHVWKRPSGEGLLRPHLARPSWVPDWGFQRNSISAALCGAQKTAEYKTNREIGGPATTLSIELHEAVLKIKGVKIDTIFAERPSYTRARNRDLPGTFTTTSKLVFESQWWPGGWFKKEDCLWYFPGSSIIFVLRKRMDHWVLLFTSELPFRQRSAWANDVTKFIRAGDYAGLLATKWFQEEAIEIR